MAHAEFDTSGLNEASQRTRDAAAPHAPSIDPAEIARFSAMAQEWWSPYGKFKPLHQMNPARLGFIKTEICRHFRRDAANSRPLEGLRLLDVGCGGGLLCEPMRRLGAEVTGLDAGIANIKTAMTHAAEAGLSIDYRAGSIEGLGAANEPPFDVILTMEVIEHVLDPAAFLASCAKMLKPGGVLFMATINRTLKAYLMAIIGAEHILRWLPAGTHAYEKFIQPSEAEAMLRAAGLDPQKPTGMTLNPLSGLWRLSEDLSVNYMLTASSPQIT